MKASYYVASNPFIPDDDLHVLFAGHSQTEPGHQIGPRVFDYYLIHYVVSGKGTFTSDNEIYELGAGASFLIEPGKLVSYRADDKSPWYYRWIAIQGKSVATLFDRSSVDWRCPIVQAAEAAAIGKQMETIETIFKKRQAGGNLRATGAFLILLADFEQSLQPDRRKMRETLSPIERHVRQVAEQLTTQYAEPIRIESLAEAYGYNRAYFSKMFKSFIHVTPVTYLLNLRVGKARQLLRERPELTIEQIAYSVGFNDPLYLSKQFKRYYGISPSEYRKSVANLEEE